MHSFVRLLTSAASGRPTKTNRYLGFPIKNSECVDCLFCSSNKNSDREHCPRVLRASLCVYNSNQELCFDTFHSLLFAWKWWPNRRYMCSCAAWRGCFWTGICRVFNSNCHKRSYIAPIVVNHCGSGFKYNCRITWYFVLFYCCQSKPDFWWSI